jgi:hypothetical protein
MSRPRGEIREAMSQALLQIASGGAAAPVRQLAEKAQVGYDAARRTLDNMARAGEVRVAGYDKPAGSKRWNAMYEIPPDEDLPQPWGGIEALAEVMRDVTAPAGA